MSVIESAFCNNGHGYISSLDHLVVHSTANPGATARNHLNLWGGGYDYAVHYVSDWDGAYQAMHDYYKAWHCGNGNDISIGIEICEATNETDFWKGIDIAAQACAEIIAYYGQQGNVWNFMVTHNWMRERYGGTTHTDPDPYFEEWGYSFNEFTHKVIDILNGGSQPEPEPVKSYGVHLHSSNGTDAQKWVFDNNHIVAACNGMQLDVMDGTAQHRQPVRVYEANDTNAQRWQLDFVDNEMDKWCYIRSALDSNYVLACKGGGKESGTGIVIGTFDEAPAQKWALVWAGWSSQYNKSMYYLVNLESGMMLDVDGGGR